MTAKYPLVLFDMDGTLLDTLGDLAVSTNHVLSAAGFPERSIDEIRSFVGEGARKLIERAVPAGTSPEAIEKLLGEFKGYYGVHCSEQTHPYDGILELVRELRTAGCKTAVVSNKPDEAVQTLTEQFFSGLFDSAAGTIEGVVRRKPAPDGINKVLEAFRLSANHAVYIGDSETDVQTANNANMKAILVDWGFRSREQLVEAGAETIVSTTEALKALLLD